MQKEKIKFAENYESIISVENLLEAWKEFERGKKNKNEYMGIFILIRNRKTKTNKRINENE